MYEHLFQERKQEELPHPDFTIQYSEMHSVHLDPGNKAPRVEQIIPGIDKPPQSGDPIPMEQLSAAERERIEARPEVPRFVGMPCPGGLGGLVVESSTLSAKQKEDWAERARLHLVHGDKVAKTDDGYLVIHPIDFGSWR